MKKKVSLKDIAAKVGVSTALVSYVLNNKKTDRIGKEIAGRIKIAAEELNYRANQIAKSLKTNKTFTIGLIVADISNPFFSALARIIEEEAAKKNYTVIFGSSEEQSEKSFKLINALLDRQVDGFIIAPAENTESNVNYLIQHDVPFVLIDRYFPLIDTNWVTLDNYKTALTAVEYLLAGGNKRPCIITYNTTLNNLRERKTGYENALQKNNIQFEKDRCKEILFDSNIKSSVEKAIDELLSLPVPIDSILFASNILAFHGLKYIHSKGIKIPGDLSIITFDEMEASDLFYAPLTYLEQPLLELGRLSTKILLENIDKKKDPVQIKLDATLVIRKSTLPVIVQ